MKKYIIIAGVPRAGKSTAAHRISEKFGYQHISMDAILGGVETVFPETGIDTDADIDAIDKIKLISSKVAPFIKAMMAGGEYDEFDRGVVIDVYQLLPSDFEKFIGSEAFDIYYFLTSDVTAEERFDILKKHDTPNDYTYFESDEDNRKSCADIVRVSKYIKSECLSLGLPCFETAHDRENILESFIASLGEKTI